MLELVTTLLSSSQMCWTGWLEFLTAVAGREISALLKGVLAVPGIQDEMEVGGGKMAMTFLPILSATE